MVSEIDEYLNFVIDGIENWRKGCGESEKKLESSRLWREAEKGRGDGDKELSCLRKRCFKESEVNPARSSQTFSFCDSSIK